MLASNYWQQVDDSDTDGRSISAPFVCANTFTRSSVVIKLDAIRGETIPIMFVGQFVIGHVRACGIWARGRRYIQAHRTCKVFIGGRARRWRRLHDRGSAISHIHSFRSVYNRIYYLARIIGCICRVRSEEPGIMHVPAIRRRSAWSNCISSNQTYARIYADHYHACAVMQ